jgi:hypothetical protein
VEVLLLLLLLLLSVVVVRNMRAQGRASRAASLAPEQS